MSTSTEHLERLASEALFEACLMPADYYRWHDLARAAIRAQAEVAIPVADTLMAACQGDERLAARAFAVARSLQGLPVPRLKSRRRKVKEAA